MKTRHTTPLAGHQKTPEGEQLTQLHITTLADRQKNPMGVQHIEITWPITVAEGPWASTSGTIGPSCDALGSSDNEQHTHPTKECVSTARPRRLPDPPFQLVTPNCYLKCDSNDAATKVCDALGKIGRFTFTFDPKDCVFKCNGNGGCDFRVSLFEVPPDSKKYVAQMASRRHRRRNCCGIVVESNAVGSKSRVIMEVHLLSGSRPEFWQLYSALIKELASGGMVSCAPPPLLLLPAIAAPAAKPPPTWQSLAATYARQHEVEQQLQGHKAEQQPQGHKAEQTAAIPLSTTVWPSENREAFQRQLNFVAATVVMAATPDPNKPPAFKKEWNGQSLLDCFEFTSYATATGVLKQLCAALGLCQCEVTTSGSWTIQADMRRPYANIGFTASIYRVGTSDDSLFVVFQRQSGDFGAYARIVDEVVLLCAGLVHSGISAFVSDTGPYMLDELYPRSCAMGKAQMQRHWEILNSYAHPSARTEAARIITRACDGADEGAASNRDILVADFPDVVSDMVGDYSPVVRLCGQAVLHLLLCFNDTAARDRTGVKEYNWRHDTDLTWAIELARKLSGDMPADARRDYSGGDAMPRGCSSSDSDDNECGAMPSGCSSVCSSDSDDCSSSDSDDYSSSDSDDYSSSDSDDCSSSDSDVCSSSDSDDCSSSDSDVCSSVCSSDYRREIAASNCHKRAVAQHGADLLRFCYGGHGHGHSGSCNRCDEHPCYCLACNPVRLPHTRQLPAKTVRTAKLVRTIWR